MSSGIVVPLDLAETIHSLRRERLGHLEALLGKVEVDSGVVRSERGLERPEPRARRRHRLRHRNEAHSEDEEVPCRLAGDPRGAAKCPVRWAATRLPLAAAARTTSLTSSGRHCDAGRLLVNQKVVAPRWRFQSASWTLSKPAAMSLLRGWDAELRICSSTTASDDQKVLRDRDKQSDFRLNVDSGFLALGRSDRRGSVGQRVKAAASLREGDHVAD